MKFNILTIFPNIIDSYISESIIARARKSSYIDVEIINIRDFTQDKHNKVDDAPYGGGAGMVMKPEPIYFALDSITALKDDTDKEKRSFLLSPEGKKFNQDQAQHFSKLDEITMVCGRYQGVDQRVSDYMVDQKLSVGPYVLSGGELPALIVLEATTRLIPGVLGDSDSLKKETEFKQTNKKRGSIPQYTRPRKFKGWGVPDVLLSGNHKKIRRWREENRNDYS
jgi:tRNA (guanine37-N1)-methyltransferase